MFKYCIMPFFQLIMHNIYDVTFILNQSLSILSIVCMYLDFNIYISVVSLK